MSATISGMQLMRLRDCAQSTRLGILYQWPSRDMMTLLSLGLTKAVGNGWQTTPAGDSYLNEHREEVAKL